MFWERFRFHPGRSPMVVSTPWGRVGFAICADMIYRHVWSDYRDRIDLAVVSAAWPDFADRDSGAGTGCSATWGPSPTRFRRRSRWISAFRSYSRISVAKPARPSPSWVRRSAIGSPARAAFAMGGMVNRCVPAASHRFSSLRSPSTSSEDQNRGVLRSPRPPWPLVPNRHFRDWNLGRFGLWPGIPPQGLADAQSPPCDHFSTRLN